MFTFCKCDTCPVMHLFGNDDDAYEDYLCEGCDPYEYDYDYEGDEEYEQE